MAVRVIKDELKGKKVLDMCAAPGGKTAQLLDYGARVVAQDIAEDRLNILKENIKRIKLDENLEVRCVDATTFECNEKFDVVLLDAPCSATGTFRRHPEIVHTKTIKDVNKMAKIQEKILDKAVLFLKDNGILVYATCSLAKDEGERQIYKFLEKNKDFVIKKIILKDDYGAITKDGFFRILPQTLKEYFGTDGFFVACLQRKK
jgi:16S rRNA (cytosine967-C5)-methyltransferase